MDYGCQPAETETVTKLWEGLTVTVRSVYGYYDRNTANIISVAECERADLCIGTISIEVDLRCVNLTHVK